MWSRLSEVARRADLRLCPLSNLVSTMVVVVRAVCSLTRHSPAIFENYVAEIRLDGKAVQLALWDTA